MYYVDDIINKRGSVSFIIDGDEYSLESTIKLFGENNDRLFLRLLASSVYLDGALIKDVIGLMSKFSDQIEVMTGCDINSFYNAALKSEVIPNAKAKFYIRSTNILRNYRESRMSSVGLGLKEGSMTKIEFLEPDGRKALERNTSILFDNGDGEINHGGFIFGSNIMNIPIVMFDGEEIKIEKDDGSYDVFALHVENKSIPFIDMINYFIYDILDSYGDYESMISNNEEIKNMMMIMDNSDFNIMNKSIADMIKDFKLTKEAIFTINTIKNREDLITKVYETVVEISDFGDTSIKIEGDYVVVKSSGGVSEKINMNWL